MQKFFLSLWGKIVDHILGIFLTTIITTPFILEIFTKIKPVTRLVVPFLLWQWSGWIALVIILVVLWIRNKIEKRQTNKQTIIRKPPQYYASFDRRVEECEFAGVIWRILVGTNLEPSKAKLSRESVFAWPLPGAYCSECDYELERRRTAWYCMPCKKTYRIPKEIRQNTLEKVRRNYERLIVQWGYNNFGIANDNHKPLRVLIRDSKKEK